MKSRASEVIQRDSDCKKQERSGMEWLEEKKKGMLGLHPGMPE
jgi:hypothetical protein